MDLTIHLNIIFFNRICHIIHVDDMNRHHVHVLRHVRLHLLDLQVQEAYRVREVHKERQALKVIREKKEHKDLLGFQLKQEPQELKDLQVHRDLEVIQEHRDLLGFQLKQEQQEPKVLQDQLIQMHYPLPLPMKQVDQLQLILHM